MSQAFDHHAHHCGDALDESGFTAVADCIPVLIWLADVKGNRRINRAYRERIGVSESLLRRDEWMQYLHPDDRDSFLASFREKSASGEGFEAQFRLRGSDGTYRWMKSVAATRTSERGEFLGFVGVSVDIHELREAQNALRVADDSKNRFLAVLAHELRSPLAAVTNASQVMGVVASGSEPYLAARAIMGRQIANMTRLIDDLADLGRMAHGQVRLQKERSDLVEALKHTIHSSVAECEQRDIHLLVDLPETPIWVDADPLRLDQIFSNVLGNALKFTPSGGQVWLSAVASFDGAAQTSPTQTSSPSSPTEPWVTVRIRDSGRGIPPAMLEQIFAPFAQIDPGGSTARYSMGLGLALTKQLVELHDGRIEAISAGPGLGSEFVVRLPLARAYRQQVAPLVSSALAHRRVLIVEDNHDAAAALSLMLEHAGLDVEVAHDGSSALAKAREHLPEAILLDVDLPDMSGWELARQFREDPRFAECLMVAVTGLSGGEGHGTCRDVGIDHHLVKPLELPVLIRLIEQRFGERRSGQQ